MRITDSFGPLVIDLSQNRPGVRNKKSMKVPARAQKPCRSRSPAFHRHKKSGFRAPQSAGLRTTQSAWDKVVGSIPTLHAPVAQYAGTTNSRRPIRPQTAVRVGDRPYVRVPGRARSATAERRIERNSRRSRAVTIIEIQGQSWRARLWGEDDPRDPQG